MGRFSKEPSKNGLEQDWTTPWRRLLCYCKRPKVGRFVKRSMNRRARQRGRVEIRESF